MTRPDPQSRGFAAAFQARFGSDWPVILSPLTEIRLLDAGPVPTGADGIIFTSQNAVDGFSRLVPDRDLTAWCVGDRTAEAARQRGFDVQIGPGDAASLAELILTRRAGHRLIYPRGRTVAVDMAALLKAGGIEVFPLVVYDQTRRPPTPEALTVMRGSRPVLLPLFSPRSARIAAESFRDTTAPLFIAAISPAVAEAAAALTARNLSVSTRPDADAMLDALAELVAKANMP